ncbi:MAG: FHA domain-containing protein [Polyangiaceae bacterium]
MGFFDRLRGRHRAESRAKKRELAGDLEKATELYLEADRPEEAVRLLLLRADAEGDPHKRMVLCAQAARIGEGTEAGDEALKRKARLGFDVVKGAQGATMKGELVRVAQELETAGDWETAAEAFRLAGDTEAEIRVLKEAGAIEQLEERLHATSAVAKKERDRAQLLRRMRDLDSIAERRLALKAGSEWLDRERDEQIELEVERIRQKLVAGPVLELTVHGIPTTYVLGEQVTIGRARADIVVHQSGVSRQHLRLHREDGRALVEDLDTRNGTTIAGGARVTGSIPIGSGLSLELAGQVPCRLEPVLASEPDGPIAVQVGGKHYVVPLGPLRIAGWLLTDAHHGSDRFVVLRTLDGRDPPHKAGYQLAREIELSEGDEIRDGRDGEVIIAVPERRAAPSLG